MVSVLLIIFISSYILPLGSAQVETLPRCRLLVRLGLALVKLRSVSDSPWRGVAWHGLVCICTRPGHLLFSVTGGFYLRRLWPVTDVCSPCFSRTLGRSAVPLSVLSPSSPLLFSLFLLSISPFIALSHHHFFPPPFIPAMPFQSSFISVSPSPLLSASPTPPTPFPS